MSSDQGPWLYSAPNRPLTTQLQLQFFEDLPLGGEWTTRRRTVTESDMSLFGGLVGDFSPLVVDAEHAAASHFGGRVASGPFLVATAIGLGSMDTPLPQSAGLVGMTWRFLKPARAGDTLYTVWRLARKRPVENPNWGLAVWQVTIRNQHAETLAEGEVARLVGRRKIGGHAARDLGRASRKLVGAVGDAIFREHDRGRAKGVGLDEVGPDLHILGVDSGYDVRARLAQDLVAAVLAREIIGRKPRSLQHRPHGAVEDEHALAHPRQQRKAGAPLGQRELRPAVGRRGAGVV